mmetsp:Transcript_108872/g.314392  ORF Transcript_108872/g.314392 Transcript_108872/m.314392 type:complete len:327 (-) Transcript_108872:870-1850(-)
MCSGWRPTHRRTPRRAAKAKERARAAATATMEAAGAKARAAAAVAWAARVAWTTVSRDLRMTSARANSVSRAMAADVVLVAVLWKAKAARESEAKAETASAKAARSAEAAAAASGPSAVAARASAVAASARAVPRACVGRIRCFRRMAPWSAARWAAARVGVRLQAVQATQGRWMAEPRAARAQWARCGRSARAARQRAGRRRRAPISLAAWPVHTRPTREACRCLSGACRQCRRCISPTTSCRRQAAASSSYRPRRARQVALALPPWRSPRAPHRRRVPADRCRARPWLVGRRSSLCRCRPHPRREQRWRTRCRGRSSTTLGGTT